MALTLVDVVAIAPAAFVLGVVVGLIVAARLRA